MTAPWLGRCFRQLKTVRFFYQAGESIGGSRIVWLDRNGNEVSTLGVPAAYSSPRISPDGKRAAVTSTDAATGNRDIWIYDIDGGQGRRLTFDTAREGNPTWTSDGSRIVFNSNQKGVLDLLWTAASGSGVPEVLLESETNKFPQTISPDGDA